VSTSIIILVLQTQSKSVPSHNHDKRADNPCLNAPEDEVIPMESGNIICKSPSDEELEQKLKTHASGMNRHYFANSMYDARRNFKNLFEIYGKYLDNTTQWQDWVNDRPITSPYVDSVLVQSLQENAKRGVEVEKRGSGVVIQCLPGGRLTAKGGYGMMMMIDDDDDDDAVVAIIMMTMVLVMMMMHERENTHTQTNIPKQTNKQKIIIINIARLNGQ